MSVFALRLLPGFVFCTLLSLLPPPLRCFPLACVGEQTSALFDAAKKAEDQITSLSEEEDRNRLSKGGFFMLCALGTANFSRVRNALD